MGKEYNNGRQYLPSRQAAKSLGLHPHTLRRYADAGIIPSIRTQSGQRRYDVRSYLGKSKNSTTIRYCRVSSHKQTGGLQRQAAFMQEHFPNAEVITDAASGLNYRRRGLATILERIHQGDKLTPVVAYRDRLARFGTELIEQILQQNGGELLVLNQRDLSPPEELTQDLLAVLTVFSARANGLRRYRKKIREDKNLPRPGPEGQA